MIRHQAKAEQAEGITLVCLAECLEEEEVVIGLVKDRSAVVARVIASAANWVSGVDDFALFGPILKE